MTRENLPSLRRSITKSSCYSGAELNGTIGLFPDGRPGEVFGNIGRAGNELERTMNDACVALSIALQHSATVSDLAHTISDRKSGIEVSSVVAVVVNVLAELDQECAA